MGRTRCYACDKPIKPSGKAYEVVTEDGQRQIVGPDCFRKVEQAEAGYHPPKGGPKLFTAGGPVNG